MHQTVTRHGRALAIQVASGDLSTHSRQPTGCNGPPHPLVTAITAHLNFSPLIRCTRQLTRITQRLSRSMRRATATLPVITASHHRFGRAAAALTCSSSSAACASCARRTRTRCSRRGRTSRLPSATQVTSAQDSATSAQDVVSLSMGDSFQQAPLRDTACRTRFGRFCTGSPIGARVP